MRERPYRTGATQLSDDQLILLDALFDLGAGVDLLRRGVFEVQWNFGYGHTLDDAALARNLLWLCGHGVLAAEGDGGRACYRMTPGGGELWSQERCPVWDRYCDHSSRTTPRGRTLMSVVAGAPAVRDHILDLWPESPPLRRRTAVFAEYRLVGWRPPAPGYVGLVTYEEPHQWTADEYLVWAERQRERRARLERERSWWRTVPELQRFVP
ncbi:hypothetical protein J0H58_03530 [bacterium]|nr:hypothetical protein [bacterium]